MLGESMMLAGFIRRRKQNVGIQKQNLTDRNFHKFLLYSSSTFRESLP